MKLKDIELKDIKVTEEEFHFLIVAISDLQMKVVMEDTQTLKHERKKEILETLNGLMMKVIRSNTRNKD
jgi:hypothetical protein